MEPMPKSLVPESRSDRRYFWARFKHPITNETLRVGLGENMDEAAAICNDLSFMIANSSKLKSMHDEALDGFHERAISAFFEPITDALNAARFQLLQTSIEALKEQLNTTTLCLDLRWMLDPEYKRLTLKGEINLCDGMINENPDFVAADRERAQAKKLAEEAHIASQKENRRAKNRLAKKRRAKSLG